MTSTTVASTQAFVSSSEPRRSSWRCQTGPPFVVEPITSVNTAANEEDPWLSPDGSRLFFASDREGSWDLYEAAAL
jgi:Tol biopolymer transport system component